MEYKREMAEQGNKENSVKDLLEFRMEIAYYLVRTVENIRKRGRPLSSEPVTIVTQRQRTEIRPIQDVQYDNMAHMPKIDNNKEATRCKLVGCKGRTHFFLNM